MVTVSHYFEQALKSDAALSQDGGTTNHGLLKEQKQSEASKGRAT